MAARKKGKRRSKRKSPTRRRVAGRRSNPEDRLLNALATVKKGLREADKHAKQIRKSVTRRSFD